MKYTVQIDIDLPRERVFELLTDPANRSKWQRGLQTAEVVEGEAGQVGARTRLVFGQGKRAMEMMETLTERTPPERVTHVFDGKGVHNSVANRLSEVDAARTRLFADSEFEFSGFMKVIAFLARKAFPRQTLKILNDFKAFAEDGADANA